ncbi:hypothetical protein H8E52_12835 [bacterium]|nr:hypothetical protein [bacterium]
MPTMKMRFLLPLLLLAASLLAACSDSGSPVDPYLGSWVIDIEKSFAKSQINEDLKDKDPEFVRAEITGMSQVISLVVADSTITYSRGRHSKTLPFDVEAGEPGKLALAVYDDTQVVHWILNLDEDGYLHLESTRSRFTNYYVYIREELAEDVEYEQPVKGK